MRQIWRAVKALGMLSAFSVMFTPVASHAEAKDRAAWSSAQSGSAQTANGIAAPTIKVYSRETVVDVTVTDKDGKPVHGLTQADFSVTEDDKPQSIRSLKESGEVARTGVAEVSTARRLPTNTYTNVQTATGPLYVLLDAGKWAGEATAQIIRNLGPGVRLLQVGGVGRLTVLPGTTEPGLRPGKVIGINPIKLPPGLMGCAKTIALDWQKLEELHELATFLSGIEGRKNLIWVGGNTSDLTWNGCQVWNGPLRETYDLLEDAQIAMYPVDSIGIRVPDATPISGSFIGQVDPSGIQAPDVTPVSGSFIGQGAKDDASWLGDVRVQHLSMEAVAEATGGQAFYNTNDIPGAIANAANAGSSYYTLSYVPAGVEYDGRFHTINIKVNRPGIHLLYHQGYSAEDPALIEHPPETLFGAVTRDTRPSGDAADPLAAAMSLTAPPATQLPFDVRVEPSTVPVTPTDPAVMGFLDAKLRNAPLTRYGFLYSMPVGQIAFGSEPGTHGRGTLELVVVAYDGGGSVVSSLQQAIEVNLPADQTTRATGSPLQYLLQIDLPPGRLHVLVGVRDKLSNKVGTVEIPLSVGKDISVARK